MNCSFYSVNLYHEYRVNIIVKKIIRYNNMCCIVGQTRPFNLGWQLVHENDNSKWQFKSSLARVQQLYPVKTHLLREPEQEWRLCWYCIPLFHVWNLSVLSEGIMEAIFSLPLCQAFILPRKSAFIFLAFSFSSLTFSQANSNNWYFYILGYS